jgi:hypothetical protein
MPRIQSGSGRALLPKASAANVAEPTIDVTQVDASAAGATSATDMPVATRMGAITEPPPIP